MDTLTLGKHNPRLADIRRAIDRSALTSDGLLPIEGWKLLGEAQASGLLITAVFLRQDTAPRNLPEGVPWYALERAAFKTIQSTETSQGVVALVRPRVFELKDLIDKQPAMIVILAGLQDPGNVGTIIRVAESFAAAGCIGLSGTAALYNSKVTRASAGSAFRLPCLWNMEMADVAAQLKTRGIEIIGTSPRASESITSWDWRQSAAVLIGSEGSGLREDYIRQCDRLLNIPHEPHVESLNSAVSAAVILYEAFRQRDLR